MHAKQALKRISIYQCAAIAAMAMFFVAIQITSANAFFVNVKPQPFQHALGVALSKEDYRAADIAEELTQPAATPAALEPEPKSIDLHKMIETLALLHVPYGDKHAF